MRAKRTFFVRHGSYESAGLTEAGKREAEGAAHALARLGLEATTTLVHSSHHLRAVQTAEVIVRILGCEPCTSDEIVAMCGEHPDGVQDLDATIDTAMCKQGVDPKGKDLVVVTHMPLVSYLVHGDPYEPVPNCFIHEYNGTWNAQEYQRAPFGILLEELLRS